MQDIEEKVGRHLGGQQDMAPGRQEIAGFNLLAGFVILEQSRARTGIIQGISAGLGELVCGHEEKIQRKEAFSLYR